MPTIWSALALQQLQIVAVELDRQLAFDAADCLLHVVRDGLREVPYHPRHLLQLAIHGANQFFFVLVEGRAPLVLGKQVDKIFGVEKARGIGAVVGPSLPGETTSVTSGNAARMMRALFIVSTPAVGPVLGASVPLTQMAPSSRWGRNSEPMTPLSPRKPARSSAHTATPTVT